MTKECASIRKKISEYAQNELDAEESLRIRDHLDVCPACVREYENARQFVSGLELLRSDAAEDSAVLRQKMKAVVAGMGEDFPRLSLLGRISGWGLAAAALSVAILFSTLAINSHNLKVEQSLVDQELVQSFVLDNKDTVYTFAYEPSEQTEYTLFEEFYDFFVKENGTEDSKILKSNFKYLVQNIDQLI